MTKNLRKCGILTAKTYKSKTLNHHGPALGGSCWGSAQKIQNPKPETLIPKPETLNPI